MAHETLRGHCCCGFIQYEVQGPFFHETNCCCHICSRAAGAPFVPWATVERSKFRVLAGQPASFQSSLEGTRTFCPRCGTPLTFTTTRYPDDIDFTICTLESPAAVAPRDVTFATSMPPWLPDFPHLPCFARERSASPQD